jgi:predicted AAA+ superfamily ATPase
LNNFGKRVIKSPKYYFTDTGLLSYLLDIEKPSQVSRDPLVGNLFENLVVLEVLKSRYNKGLNSGLYFFRDSNGNEIDLLCRTGEGLIGIEIKSASTWNSGFTKGLNYFSKSNSKLSQSLVVYNGEAIDLSNGIKAISYKNIEF